MDPHEEEEFTAFVSDAGGRLTAFAHLLIGDRGEAEDAVQVALLRLTRHWSRGIGLPEAYVRRALVNIARDRARRRHLVPLLTRSGHLADRGAPAPPSALEQHAAVEALLRPLPPRQRVAVVLRVVEGCSEAETAALMGCSVGTVKSNLHRGLQRLRAAHARAAGAGHEESGGHDETDEHEGATA